MLTISEVSAAAEARVDRIADVLRMLGRLEFVGSHWVRSLVCPDKPHPMYAWRLLERLHREKLVWRATIDPRTLPGAIRWPKGSALARHPHIYGLTEAGRAWLRAEGVEDDGAILDTFIVRDHKAPEVKPAQLAHDLLVVDWCVSAIDEARRCPLVSGIRCQLEYVSAEDGRGLPLQRFDALVALTFDVSATERPTRPPWQIPWLDRVIPEDATTRTLRFAVELDRGTEKLATLMGKAAMYAQLTQAGHYDATLGGPVLPVVVAPSGRRSSQIAREWADGWPGGAGVISSFMRVKATHGGALWGAYYTMTDNPARRVGLLDALGVTQDAWRERTAAWTHDILSRSGALDAPPAQGEEPQ